MTNTPIIISDQGVYFGAYDLTGRTNALAIKYSAEAKDATVLGLGTRKRVGGLKEVLANLEGLLCVDEIDAAMFDNIGVSDVPFSAAVDGDIVGSKAYLFKAMLGNYNPGAQIGELLKYSADAESTGYPLVSGKVILNSKGTPITANGNGTAVQLEAVTSGKTLYAALHIIEATDTCDFVLQRDSASNFPSATTAITFDQVAGAIGSQFKTNTGTSTDDWYRLNYTVSGSSPSFKAVLVAGIL